MPHMPVLYCLQDKQAKKRISLISRICIFVEETSSLSRICRKFRHFSPSYFMQFQWLFSIIHISFKVPYYFFPSPVVAFIGKFLTQLSLSILSGLCLLTTRSEKTFVKRNADFAKDLFFLQNEHFCSKFYNTLDIFSLISLSQKCPHNTFKLLLHKGLS